MRFNFSFCLLISRISSQKNQKKIVQISLLCVNPTSGEPLFWKICLWVFFSLIFSILLFFLNFVNIFSNIPCWTFSQKNTPYYLYLIVGHLNKLFRLTVKIFSSKNNFLPFKVHIVYMYFSTGWIYTEIKASSKAHKCQSCNTSLY